jgi:hypothetical protein
MSDIQVNIIVFMKSVEELLRHDLKERVFKNTHLYMKSKSGLRQQQYSRKELEPRTRCGVYSDIVITNDELSE